MISIFKKIVVNSLLVTGSFIAGSKAFSQNIISAEENYARNRPGVVKVQTEFSANVYVNKVQMNQQKFRLLVDSVKKLDTSGVILKPEQKLDIVLRVLYKTPFRFFSGTTEYLRQAHRIVSTGTGFFISGDGYLVTNCHVIDRDSIYVRKKFILSTFQDVTDANIKALQASWEVNLNDEQRNLLYNTYGVIYSQVSTMFLFDLQKKIYIEYKEEKSDSGSAVITMPANVVLKGRPMPGKDIALLKVDSVKNMPALILSKSPMAQVGSQVFVYGYPGFVANNAFLAPDAFIEPTLTTGIISGIKKSVGGWPVIQMDATISYGSSGGPVCNNQGEVIGLATFGSIEQSTGELASGFNFAIPVSILQNYVDSAKIKPQASEASELFNEGLAMYYKEYYRNALRKFESVQKLNNAYSQLDLYISNSKNRIEAGADKESFLLRIIFVFILVLIFIVAIYFFYPKLKQWYVVHYSSSK
ncbi:MAG: trypsin-like peptidase domain-containing protein [Bacteroidota bacterium]